MMRKPVFDDKTRTNGLPQGKMVSTFEFLNDAAGSAWEPPRALIQEWLNHIEDEQEYSEMVERFRSKDDAQFKGVYLELYLHEVLRKAGYSLTLHPSVPGSSKRPDFLVTKGDTKFYLEAIVPSQNPETVRQRNRDKTLWDALNKISNKNFKIILIEIKGNKKNPPARKIRHEVKKWLDTLDVDEIKEAKDEKDLISSGYGPIETISLDDWSVTIQAYLRTHESKDNRAIIASVHHPHNKDSEHIYRSLKAKGKKYGELDAPLIIAVGMYMIADGDYVDIDNALYGKSQPNGGYFGQPEDWKHQQVSAALIVDQLGPYHFHSYTRTTLWPHPGAQYPLTEDINIPLTVVQKSEAAIIEKPGIKATEFFGLSEEWPGGIRFPDLEDTK